MELRHLRAFVEVARTEHFGRAAAATKITQPALTQRIQSLEREPRVQLLTRTSREGRLTHAGESLLPYARSLVLMEDKALAELASVAAAPVGPFRIGLPSHG